jgi:tRNA(fMet)-specific endonuclease VapC
MLTMPHSNSVLLDTSVVIRHFRDAGTLSKRLADYDELYLPGPALAELYYGAFRSDRTQQHLDQIKRFLAAADVLLPDEDTSRYYGEIAAGLARKGTPIPQNDIWMAALSIQCGLPLASTDRHFQNIDGLNLLLW